MTRGGMPFEKHRIDRTVEAIGSETSSMGKMIEYEKKDVVGRRFMKLRKLGLQIRELEMRSLVWDITCEIKSL